MNKIMLFVVFLMVPVFSYGQDLATSPDKHSLLVRAFEAMNYARSFKKGLALERQQAGQTNAFIEAVLSTENAVLNDIFADVYQQHMSHKQAEELVEFYESPAGEILILKQMGEVELSAQQVQQFSSQLNKITEFSNSQTGREIAGIFEDQAVWEAIREEINSRLVYPKDEDR